MHWSRPSDTEQDQNLTNDLENKGKNNKAFDVMRFLSGAQLAN